MNHYTITDEVGYVDVERAIQQLLCFKLGWVRTGWSVPSALPGKSDHIKPVWRYVGKLA